MPKNTPPLFRRPACSPHRGFDRWLHVARAVAAARYQAVRGDDRAARRRLTRRGNRQRVLGINVVTDAGAAWRGAAAHYWALASRESRRRGVDAGRRWCTFRDSFTPSCAVRCATATSSFCTTQGGRGEAQFVEACTALGGLHRSCLAAQLTVWRGVS